MRKRNPVIAAVLSLFLGPLGCIYVGWRYAIMAVVVFSVFVLVVAVAGFTLPQWLEYVILPVLAWKAFTICSVRNILIEAGDDQARALDTFPTAAMAMSDLLVGIGMVTAGVLGLYASALMMLDGRIIKGLFTLLVGTPVLVWIATMVFGVIAGGIDAAFSRSAENVFRRQSA
jgi:hypothetical protein